MRAFTLIEALVVMTVIAILALALVPATSRIRENAERTACISHVRQIGIALRLYANDNDQHLPAPPQDDDPAARQWPVLLSTYITDKRIFAAPGDSTAKKLPPESLLDNTQNNTSFLYNGFDEPPSSSGGGLLGNLLESVGLTVGAVEKPANLCVLAQKVEGAAPFCYRARLFSTNERLLKKSAYGGGSIYLFAEGSVRYLKEEEYSPAIWRLDTSLLPPLALPPPLQPLLPGK